MKLTTILILSLTLAACSKHPCDFDQSGTVDASDIAAQEAAFNTDSKIYDVNGDGLVTGSDIEECQEAVTEVQ